MRINSSQFFKKIFFISASFLTLTLLAYALLRIKTNFLSIQMAGDEFGFVSDFNEMIANGFWESNIKGQSVLFNLFTYPIFLITKNTLLSLKITSLLSSIFAIVICYKIAKETLDLKNSLLYCFLMIITNILVVSSFMFFAYNDNLLLPFLLMFVYQYLKIKKQIISMNTFVIYSGVLLSLFISIRAMTILYIPFVLLLLIDVFKSTKINYKPVLLFFICVTTPILLLSLPSVFNKRVLSYHDKGEPAKDITWSQLQYLSALKKDKGVATKDYHVSFDEVRAYLKINGDNALPKNIKESVFFDIKITVKEFFKDYFGLLKPFIRLTGGVFLFALFFIKKEKTHNFLLYFALGFMALLSFIIISYVETRWLIGTFILVVMYLFVNIKNIQPQKIRLFLSINMLFLAVCNIPYILKNISLLLH